MELVLSEVQKRVVDHDKGHLRIVACPGSGKTEVVSRRVANLIKKGANPSEIVAFTFTEKAAESLKLRIRGILEKECPERSDFGDMYVGTIDSFCLHILKQLKPKYRSFEVLDEARRIAFIDRWYYKMNFGEMQEAGRGKWRTIKKFPDSVDRIMTERIDVSRISNKVFVKCYEEYTKKLEEERFFDFTSIIFTLLNILKNDKSALKHLNDSIKHVVFDEYQDVNRLQEELLEFLSMGSESVCVVGDDDQNIFQWRGSNIKHILDFPIKYEKYGVTTEKLDVNYRATDGLIETANRLITKNTHRVEKNMRAYDKQNRIFEEGDIVHHHFDTDGKEFDYILQTIEALVRTDFVDKHGNTYALSYRDMAVLVKTNEDAARIIGFLNDHGVKCIADSGTSVFDRPIVSFATDCICYVFGCPGYTTGDDIPTLEDLTGRYQDIVKGDQKKFQTGILKVKGRADKIFEKGYSDWLPNLGLQEFFHRILSAMGTEEGLFDEVDMCHLAVLSKAISDYEYVYQTLRARQVSGLKWFILQFAESNYSDPQYNDPTQIDAVRVLTIWKAKGLEFPVVFLPSFVKRRQQSNDEFFVDDELYERDRYDGNVEDERRAAYTAITRSQKYLFMTGAKKRAIVVKGKVSKHEILPHPFVEEMRNERILPPTNISKPKSKKAPSIQTGGTFPTSYSELSIYDRCPYDYKLRHILEFSPGVPAAFGYGTNIHNILNIIHSDFIQKKSIPTDEDIERTFDDMFYLRFAPGSQNEKMKLAGSKVVKNYVDVHRDDFERILETEKRFEFVLDEALISGDIDLIKKVNEDGEVTEIEIIDFKTDKQKEDGKYELDYSEQVRFYSYATQLSLGYKPQKALVHHLDTQEKDDVDISDEKLQETKKRIEKKVGRIVSGSFNALPEESKCAGCDFRALCSHKGFDVGVDFKPVKSEKRENIAKNDDGYDRAESYEQPTKPSIISDNVRKRAMNLASGNITKNSDGSYSIPSNSDPNKSYTVTETRCHCKGFRGYSQRHPGHMPTCSHIEAVKMYKKSHS